MSIRSKRNQRSAKLHWGVVGLVTAVAVSGPVAPLLAHECDRPPATIPSPDAVEVPPNVRLAAFMMVGSSILDAPGLFDAASYESGMPVETPTQVMKIPMLGSDVMFIMTPIEPLAPNTRYRLALGVTYYEFTTGSSAYQAPLTFDGLRSLSIDVGQARPECGRPRIVRFLLDYVPPSGAAYYLLKVREEGGSGPVQQMPVFPNQTGDGFSVNNAMCGLLVPTVEPGHTYCASLDAVDVAGNVAVSTNEVCATATACTWEETECRVPEVCTPNAGGPPESGWIGCRVESRDGGGAGAVLLAVAVVFGVRRRKRRAGAGPRDA